MALLAKDGDRLRAITTAENMLFGGDANWLSTGKTVTLQQWVTAFYADAQATSDGGETISSAERAQLLATTLPGGVSTGEANEFIDRWNLTVQYWFAAIVSGNQAPPGQGTNFLDAGVLANLFGAAQNAELASRADGYGDPAAEFRADLATVQNDLAQQGVCATVKLQIGQTATLTRSAFTGTLTLNNQMAADALQGVQLDLLITAANGNPVNEAFFISAPTFGGGLTAVDGTGSLAALSSGTVSYTFIPTDAAAPTAPALYHVGGTLRYVDPEMGGEVTTPLFPTAITVFPQAQLQINYFLQQTVIGDDPFTPQVEPGEPAVLGMLVTNTGGGTAGNLSITTAQPQIVQNEKGLAVNIQVVGTRVGSQQQTPSLTANFGDVAPGQTADASFLLLSSLQGVFEDFSATFSHSDALGGTDTSLIRTVQTHDLIHAGDFPYLGSTGATDYLVNDIPDPGSLPDAVYLSNGTTAPANVATGASADGTISASQLSVQVTASVTSGWDYIQLPDPGVGFTLEKVVRSDGTVIPVGDEAWTTDRTIAPTGRATDDHELHILDLDSTGSYTVYYVPFAQAAPTSSVAALPTFSPGSFTVGWADGGSGALSFSVYVSDNGGAFTPWLTADTQTSAVYTAGVNGHTYAFYSVAADGGGNVQPTPPGFQATTTVDTLPPTSAVAALPQLSPAAFAVSWSGGDDGSGIADFDVYVSDNGGAFVPWLTDTTQTTANYTGQDGHTYGFYSVATDNVGTIQPAPTSADATTAVNTATTTTVQSSADPSAYGQAVTFVAAVSAVAPGAAPAGQVDFVDETTGQDLGTVPLQQVGDSDQASLAVSSLTAGSHNIEAFYTSSGADYQNSNSSGLTQTVTPLTPTISWPTPGAITYGTALDGTQLDATASVPGTFVYSPAAGTVLAVGTQTLSVTFTPTDATDYTTATASVTLTVNATSQTITTTTTLTGSVTSAIPGQPVAITASVSPTASGAGTPGGSIDFFDTSTGTDLGSVSLSGGTAVLTTSALGVGSHTIQATYGGDGTFLPSDGSLSLVVTQSVYVLNPTAGGALTLSSNAAINVPGSVVVDSNSPTALTESGNAQVKAATIQVVGGVQKGGNATLSPAPVTGAAAAADPLAGLAAPTGGTFRGSVSLGGTNTQTIDPGVYSQISVSGNASLTLNTGVYVIAGGGFTVTGRASVSGNGVMIYNAGSNYPNPGGSSGSVNLSGKGAISLSPAADGSYPGVLIFQARDNASAVALSSNGIVMPGGTVYAPAAALTMDGGGQFKGSLVVGTLTLSNKSVAQLTAGDGATAVYSPAQVRTAYGINNLPLDGTGQTIAIVDAYDNPAIYQSLDAFDAQFTLTSSGSTLDQLYGSASSFLTVLNQQGQTTSLPAADPAGAGNNNGEVESALDVEWAHAVAPGAKLATASRWPT
jgi:hypothetical protein